MKQDFFFFLFTEPKGQLEKCILIIFFYSMHERTKLF